MLCISIFESEEKSFILAGRPDIITNNIGLDIAYFAVVSMVFSVYVLPDCFPTFSYRFFNLSKRVQREMEALKTKVANDEADKEQKSEYSDYKCTLRCQMMQRILLAIGAVVFCSASSWN